MNESINLDVLRVEMGRVLRQVETTIDNLCNIAHGFSEKIKELELKKSEAETPKTEA